MPTVRVAVLKVAWLEEFTDPVPSVLAPSKKVTVPDVGLLPPLPVTVAVKVTVCPVTDALTEEKTVVVVLVAAWLTVWVRVLLVLPRKSPLPP